MLRKIFQASQILRRPNIIAAQRLYSSSSSDKPPVVNNADIPIVDYDDPIHLPLPVYPRKVNESLETQKQRLIYQSRKRGMLENDLLLSTFASKYLPSMTQEQTDLYDKLINGVTNDWDIYYWATNTKPTPEEYDNEIMAKLKTHVQNENKETRVRQPNL